MRRKEIINVTNAPWPASLLEQKLKKVTQVAEVKSRPNFCTKQTFFHVLQTFLIISVWQKQYKNAVNNNIIYVVISCA